MGVVQVYSRPVNCIVQAELEPPKGSSSCVMAEVQGGKVNVPYTFPTSFCITAAKIPLEKASHIPVAKVKE